jgi:hypothetical protein
VAKDEPPKATGFFSGSRYEEDAVADPGARDSPPADASGPAADATKPAQGSSHGFFSDDRYAGSPSGFFGDTSRAAPATFEAPVVDDDDPPTDPTLRAVSAPFDPFAPGAFHIELPWYRKKSAIIAMGAIALAVIAILVAAVLLVAGQWGGDDTPRDSTSSTPVTTSSTPTTTPVDSEPPPLPPPPPPPPPPPADNGGQYYPQYPRQTQGRPNVTTPETRGPNIVVRPSHRPAFPGQPGEH